MRASQRPPTPFGHAGRGRLRTPWAHPILRRMAETSKAARPAWRAPVIAFVASLVFVVAAALAAPVVARAAIESNAKARGLKATATDVRVSLGSVRVGSFDANLEAVPGAHLSLEDMVVDLSWFRPKHVAARKGSVDVRGEWSDVIGALGALSTREADGRTTPTDVAEVALTWQLPSGRRALAIDGAKLSRTPDQKTVLSAAGLEAYGVALGAFAVELAGKDQPARAGLGANDVAAAPIVAEIAPLAEPGRLDVKLKETDAPLLLSLFSVDGLTAPRAKLVGSATLAREGRVWSGTAEGALRGWAPPVPKELGGIVFGKDTTLTAGVRADLDKQTGAFEKVTVSLGALKLVGDLAFDWSERGPGKLKGALSGSVACSALAGSALGAHLGPLAGGLAGAVAGAAIQGTVGITVRIDVDLARPSLAKVAPQISMGCKTAI